MNDYETVGLYLSPTIKIVAMYGPAVISAAVASTFSHLLNERLPSAESANGTELSQKWGSLSHMLGAWALPGLSCPLSRIPKRTVEKIISRVF